jgi:hypothetical protein
VLLAPLVRGGEVVEAGIDDDLVHSESLAELLTDLLHEILDERLDVGVSGDAMQRTRSGERGCG